MILPNRRFLAFWAAAVVLFAMVTSGGCGGTSTSNLFSGITSDDVDIAGVNSVLTGVWRLDTSAADNFVSLDADGTQAALSVLDFVMHFQSVDIEGSTGEMTYSTIAILSSDRVIFPANLNEIQAATEVILPGMWSVTGGNVNYTMTLAGTESDPSLHILGSMKPAKKANVVISLNFKKSVTRSDMTNEEMNTLINGTWQSPADGSGINGGFVFVSGDNQTLPDDGVSQERSDAPLLDGMREFDRVFANYVFEETDIASGSTIITSQLIPSTLDASGDLVGRVQPVVQYDYEDAKITPLFNGTYRIDITSFDRAILVINEAHTSARMITVSIQYDEDGGFAAVQTVQTLEKKPDAAQSTFDIVGQIGSAWRSTGLAVGEISDPSAAGQAAMVEFDFLGLVFPADKVDLANRAFTARVYAEYHDTKPENTSSSSGLISLDIPITYIERIGYNTWYADSGDDETEGDNIIIITALNQNVLVTAFLKVNGKEISITAFMAREGDIEDVFFSGAWTCTSSDAKVSISTPAYEGDPGFAGDVTLVSLGAYFSSVDVDAGTAKFSAFVLLSSDLCMIPVVFDNETVSIDRETTSNDFAITTPHGFFTVSLISGDTNRLKLNGAFDYENRGLIVHVDATVSKVITGRQLDFDSIMNKSTWQSSLSDGKSGGFALMGNAAFAAFYPGMNASTFANFVFDGNSTSGDVSGFGTMGLVSLDLGTGRFVDSGTMLPITLIHTPAKVTQIFGSYYKFDFESENADVKGVFILESESTARMLLFVAMGTPERVTILYSVFYLHKVTESVAIDLTAFNNTSWIGEKAGGYFLMPPDYAFPYTITNGEPDTHSLSLSSMDVKFTSADLSAGTVSFTVSANANMPALSPEPYNWSLIRKAKIERVGAYTWSGKTVGENADGSEFLLVMFASRPGKAELAGNINFASQLNPGMYAHASVLFDMVRKE